MGHAGGLWIISPAGKHLGTLRGPEHPHNLAWGDDDGKTLYLTAQTGLYRLRLEGPGMLLGLPMLAAAPAPIPAAIQAVQGVALTVGDCDRAAAFYEKALFFEKVSDVERQGPNSRVRVVRMRLGDEMLELIEDPAADRSPQRLAIVVNDLEQADLRLRRIRTIHFNDPDGHPLALVQFPARGRDPRSWPRSAPGR